MEKFLHLSHPLRCNFTEPTCCFKSVFLKNLILNICNDFDKSHIHSTTLHHDLDQKLKKCFSIYIPTHVTPNFVSEKDVDGEIHREGNEKHFDKSDRETKNEIEELNNPRDYEDHSKKN